MRTLAEVIGIVVWCFAVYVCSYDWGGGRVRAESGNRFPEIGK
jgi:hypothetical protein